jgi:hypothetical protein
VISESVAFKLEPLAIFLVPLVKSITSQVVGGFSFGFFEVLGDLTASQQFESMMSLPGSEHLLWCKQATFASLIN